MAKQCPFGGTKIEIWVSLLHVDRVSQAAQCPACGATRMLEVRSGKKLGIKAHLVFPSHLPCSKETSRQRSCWKRDGDGIWRYQMAKEKIPGASPTEALS